MCDNVPRMLCTGFTIGTRFTYVPPAIQLTQSVTISTTDSSKLSRFRVSFGIVDTRTKLDKGYRATLSRNK